MDPVTSHASEEPHGGAEVELPKGGYMAMFALGLSLLSVLIGIYAVHETRQFRNTVESHQRLERYWFLLGEISRGNEEDSAPYSCFVGKGGRDVALDEISGLFGLPEVRAIQSAKHLSIVAASQFCAARYNEAVALMREATNKPASVQEKVFGLMQLGYIQMARTDGKAAPDEARDLFKTARRSVEPPGFPSFSVPLWDAWVLWIMSEAEFIGGDKQSAYRMIVESQNIKSDYVAGRMVDASQLCQDNDRMAMKFGVSAVERLKFSCTLDEFGSTIVKAR